MFTQRQDFVRQKTGFWATSETGSSAASWQIWLSVFMLCYCDSVKEAMGGMRPALIQFSVQIQMREI